MVVGKCFKENASENKTVNCVSRIPINKKRLVNELVYCPSFLRFYFTCAVLDMNYTIVSLLLLDGYSIRMLYLDNKPIYRFAKSQNETLLRYFLYAARYLAEA